MFYLLRRFQEISRSCLSALFVVFLVIALICSLFLNFFLSASKSFATTLTASPSRPTIAITQIVQHPSLDKVRQGVIDELAKNGYVDGKSLNLIFKNAQGNIAIAAQIAQQLVAQKPNVIIAITTPSAQTLAKATAQSQLPLVFSSVTDPLQAQLVKDLKHPGKNITGTRNVTPIAEEIQLIKQVLPQVKTIGIVLNEAEPNSVQLLKIFTAVAQANGLAVKAVAVASSAEVQLALVSLSSKIDALFLLQDNTVASALPIVLKVAQSKQLPVFSSYLDAVKEGALAGLAGDEYKIGQQTARMAIQILKGKNPGDLAVEDPAEINLALNLETAKRLHLNFSTVLIKKAMAIYPTTGGGL